MQVLERLRDAVEDRKAELYKQQDMMREVFISKDREIAELRNRLQLANKQIRDFEAYVAKQKKDIQDDEQKILERAILSQQLKGGEDDESPRNFKNKIQHLPITSDLEDYKAAADQRKNNLENMNKIVGRLLNKALVDKDC